MFGCLGVALFVDGIDGTLARGFKVADVLPRWSGDVLDLVVDFVTYVFVPAYAIASGGLLPDRLALPPGLALFLTGPPFFAHPSIKAPGHYLPRVPRPLAAGPFSLLPPQ